MATQYITTANYATLLAIEANIIAHQANTLATSLNFAVNSVVGIIPLSESYAQIASSNADLANDYRTLAFSNARDAQSNASWANTFSELAFSNARDAQSNADLANMYRNWASLNSMDALSNAGLANIYRNWAFSSAENATSNAGWANTFRDLAFSNAMDAQSNASWANTFRELAFSNAQAANIFATRANADAMSISALIPEGTSALLVQVLGNLLFSNTTANVIFPTFPTMNLVLGNTTTLTSTANRFEVLSGNAFIATNVVTSGLCQAGYFVGDISNTTSRNLLFSNTAANVIFQTFPTMNLVLGNTTTLTSTANRFEVLSGNAFIATNVVTSGLCQAGYFVGDISNTTGRNLLFSNVNPNVIFPTFPSMNLVLGGRLGFFYQMYSEYFGSVNSGLDNVNWFTGKTPTASGVVTNMTDINTATNGVAPLTGLTIFSVQWTGFFTPNATGQWTFSTATDDASYVWIGPTAVSGFTVQNAIVNNGGIHGTRTISGVVNLVAGTSYPIRIQYGQNLSGYTFNFSFAGPGQSQTSDGSSYFNFNYVTANRFEVLSGNAFIATNLICARDIVGTLNGDIRRGAVTQVKIEEFGNVSLYSTTTSAWNAVKYPITLLRDTEIRGNLWMNNSVTSNITLHHEGKYIGNAESWSFINSNIVTRNRLFIGYNETTTPPTVSGDANLYVSSNAIVGGLCRAGYFVGDISNTTGAASLSKLDVTGQLNVFFLSSTSNAFNVSGNVWTNGISTATQFVGDISRCTGLITSKWTNVASTRDVYLNANVAIGGAPASISNAFDVYGNAYVSGQLSAEQFFIVALSDEFGGLSVSNTASMCTFRTPTRWMLTRPPRFTLETPLSNVNIPFVPLQEFPPVALTTNTSLPGFAAGASSEQSSSYQAWHAFNKTSAGTGTTTAGFWRSSTGTFTAATPGVGTGIGQFLQLVIPSPMILVGYEISAVNDSTTNILQTSPQSWQIQAFNGMGWTTIDSRNDGNLLNTLGKTFQAGIGGTPFTNPTPTAFQAFRILVTQIRGGGGGLTYVSIGELKFFGKASVDSTVTTTYVSQTHMEFDIRTNTDNVYRSGTQTSLYSSHPFLMTQQDTYNSANSFTQLTTSRPPLGTTLNPSGTLSSTIIEDDTEVGVFLSNAWTSFSATQVYNGPNRVVLTNTNATGAKVIFYYRTLFN